MLLRQELGEKRTREEVATMPAFACRCDLERMRQVFKGLVSNCSTYFGYSEELAEYFLQMFSPETAMKFVEAVAARSCTVATSSRQFAAYR